MEKVNLYDGLELFHLAWRNTRSKVKQAREVHDKELARLQKYADSKAGQAEIEKANEKFTADLKAAHDDAASSFNAAFSMMQKSLDKVPMTPPTDEQVRTLSMLELRDEISAVEMEQAVKVMRSSDTALQTLRDIAKRKGAAIPADIRTNAEQADEIVERLHRAASSLCVWDGRPEREIMAQRIGERGAMLHAGGAAPSGELSLACIAADIEAGADKFATARNIVGGGALGIDAHSDALKMLA